MHDFSYELMIHEYIDYKSYKWSIKNEDKLFLKKKKKKKNEDKLNSTKLMINKKNLVEESIVINESHKG